MERTNRDSQVVCKLKSLYGYHEEEMTDIEDQPVDDLLGLGNPKVQTPRKLASLLYLLQRSLADGAKVTPEEWVAVPALFSVTEEHTATLQSALSKVAWINVKKASRGDGTRLKPEEAYEHAARNKDVLLQQLKATAPGLIIVCGQVAFRALCENQILDSSIVLGRKWQMQTAGDGTQVIEVSHPAYFVDWNSYEAIYKNYEVIYDQLINWKDCPTFPNTVQDAPTRETPFRP